MTQTVSNHIERLKYNILEYTSEDPEYPVRELLTHNVNTKGWQSVRGSSFPQIILISFEGSVKIRQIQLLSHQSKISSRIELYTSNNDLDDENTIIDFKRLGYLSLDNNARSNFEAREFKSVYVNINATHLKICFGKNWTNKFNTYNQVGIIALNILGEYLFDEKFNLDQPNSEPQYVNQIPYDQDHQQTKISNLSRNNDIEIDKLIELKQIAVENENYDEAKQLKIKIERLTQIKDQIYQLEQEKKEAVMREDYDKAQQIKNYIDSLKTGEQNNAIQKIQLEKRNYNDNNNNNHGIYANQDNNYSNNFDNKYNSKYDSFYNQSNNNQEEYQDEELEEELMYESTHNADKFNYNRNRNDEYNTKISPSENANQNYEIQDNKNAYVEHEEKALVGNANFLEMLDKELEKQANVGLSNNNTNTRKPKKEFLKKGKKIEELKEKNIENQMRKHQNNNVKKDQIDIHTKQEMNYEESYVENVCYFCGKASLQHGLDEHFYKECKMLTSCTYCNQIVEISSLSEHYLTECENKNIFRLCKMCDMAVLSEQYSDHEHTCRGRITGKVQCMVCMQYVDDSDKGWKDHLMQDRCKNKRI